MIDDMTTAPQLMIHQPSTWRIDMERAGRWPWHVSWIVTDGQRRFTCATEYDAAWLAIALHQRQIWIDQLLISEEAL